MARIRVIGERDPQREAIGPDLGALAEFDGAAAKVDNVQAARVDVTRAAAEPEVLDGLKNDTIVELTLDGGVRFWLRYDQLADDLPAAHSRGGAGEPDTIDLPLTLEGPATRGGIGESIIEAVRTFDIDLPGLLGGAAGTAAGPELAERFDLWRMEKTGLGCWVCTAAENVAVTAPVQAADLVGNDPLLLFIHGTASSTEGSFGGLRQPAATADEAWRGAAWLGLARAYGERVVAYEHQTLSVSPIDNAIELLAALPDDARLHVVSHSRGGMIGELLCRAQRVDGKAPFAGELDALKCWVEDKPGRYRRELEKLVELEKLLLDKRPRVERFVRVACPAAGTTLASERLDRWLSVLTNVLDLTGLGASLTYRCVKGFLLAAVKTRTDPRSVPGLEAMLPASLLTAVLNRPGVQTAADLSVIAGDIEGGSLLGRLALKVADWFYGGNHDLVVDTLAMYGGLARERGARVFFDQGGEVSHFGYFRNRRTVERLVAALRRGEDDEAGFVRLERPKEIDQRVYGRRDGVPRPAVFILPGLMGSHLAVGDDRIWIDIADIAWGRLAEIAVDRAGVRPEALVADAYRGLIDRLSGSHEVVPFPYDWRRSLQQEGKRLADALADRLASSTEPVRIVGHSMGGLLALAAFALRPQLWRDFAARPGCRLLMLGTPCGGSFAIPRALLAEERLVTYLALLDIQHSQEELLGIIGAFPGFLELLPADGALDLFAPTTWERMQRAKRKGWIPPTADALGEARKTRTLLDGVPIDPERVLYVAGVAAATPVGIEIEAERRVRFLATARGDGRVPWDTGIPAGVNVWYATAEHGELASHAPAFAAYAELLESGTTSQLPRTPPAPARTAAVPFELPPDRAPVFPDEHELAAAALGYRQKPPRVPQRKTQLRLVHGNLQFARWPVAVGHYIGDTLAGSEGQLDRVLDGRLTRRRDLRIYPGAIETAEIVLDPRLSPRGAVVVGLGPVGEVTPGELRRSLVHALRSYALAAREMGLAAGGGVGISVLLVGAGEGGISIRDSVSATLDAVAHANLALGEDALAEIEMLELYEDRAIQAAQAIGLALKESNLGDLIEFDGQVRTGEGGRRRAAAEEDPDWWRRRQVTQRRDGGLHFTDLTDRARAEVSLVADQRALVDRFVRRAVVRPTAIDEADDPGATLFELMLPTRLKEEARSDRHLVLVLDKATAGYPWELLHDGGRGERRPPAVRAGLIRQLIEQDFAERPNMAIGNRALVVGDPPSGMREFPPLDGAKVEAERVAELLADHGRFAVTDRIRSDPERIVSALMDGRGWRVLHLAAHGDLDFPTSNGPVTGMVLGEGLFLTPATIRQLAAVPELVFLNCCHLGRVDAAAERRTEARYPELAANLATAFIKLGARAVVAAGWAVDDAAAKLFAETLYVGLLAGGELGKAVQAARSETYRAYPRTNTWGAYQCYGDPAYRLIRERPADGSGPDEQPFTHMREAVVAIENITQDAQTMAVRDPEELGKRLEATLQRLPSGWQRRPELCTCLGEACGELGRLDEAIGHYAAALAAEKASTPVRTIEQLANLRARRAAIGAARDRKAAAAEIEGAIKVIQDLQALAGGEPTVERLSLLGSCCKRLAQVSGGRERDKALAAMAEHYRRAHERAQKDGKLNPYPLLNWLLAEELRAVRDPKVKAPADVEAWLNKAEVAAVPADEAEPGFWNAITLADAMLGRLLARGQLTPNNQSEVVDAYLRPWKRGASPLKFASVLEQLDFVAEVLSDGPAPTQGVRDELRKALRSIAERLRAATGVR